jgi:hypothetical protein
VDEAGSGSFPKPDFGTGGVKISDCFTRALVTTKQNLVPDVNR